MKKNGDVSLKALAIHTLKARAASLIGYMALVMLNVEPLV